jgi:peptide/nickel transport system ATP-binding protein
VPVRPIAGHGIGGSSHDLGGQGPARGADPARRDISYTGTPQITAPPALHPSGEGPARASAQALLQVQDLRVSFATEGGEVRAVDGVTLAIHRAQTLGIVGESGSGKSVTALSVLGLTRAEGASVSGSVQFAGRDLLALGEQQLRSVRGTEIAMVFQDPLSSLHPMYRVGAQIIEAIRAHRDVAKAPARRRAVELLELVGIPDPAKRVDSYPHELSGGQRQRVMIAMALANDPALLIADEPTSALDVTVQAQILELLRRLRRERGMALMLVTHDFGVVAEMADEIAVMHAGRVVEEAPADRLLTAPQHPYTQRLLRSIPSGRRLCTGDGESPGAATERRTEPLLRVSCLVKDYPVDRGVMLRRNLGTVKALDGVSFEVMPGETFGIVGESGSGKSTTARLIARLIEPTAGEVWFEGRDITALTGARLKQVRRELQIVFQDPYSSLNPRRTIGATLGEPLAIHHAGSNRQKRRHAVAELMEMVGLSPAYVNRYPHEFSGGQRQRIGIARALALRPKLLIADEPVSALDVSIQAQVLDLLTDLQRRLGLTMVFISHDLSVIRHMCDRVAVMHDGRIVELESGERLYSAPRDPYTRELLAAVPSMRRARERTIPV